MKPVLMAASLSPRGVAVLRRAGALARAADAPLELLHAVSPFAPRKAERSAYFPTARWSEFTWLRFHCLKTQASRVIPIYS